MASGVPGGPYGLIRDLRRQIQDCKYELGLIAEGMRRRPGKKRNEEIIAHNKERIKRILAEEKAKNGK